MADDQPSPRLSGLRRRRPLPPAGHDGDDRPQQAPLSLHQAYPPEPGPRPVRRSRDEPLHRLLSLRPLLQGLRRRYRPGRLWRPRQRLFRPCRGRCPGERVLRQPDRGLPHRGVHRQDPLRALQPQVGHAVRPEHLPWLLVGLQHQPRRALWRPAPHREPLQRLGEPVFPLRPWPLRLWLCQSQGSSAPGPAERWQPGNRDRRRPGSRRPAAARQEGDRHRLAACQPGKQPRPARTGRRRELLQRHECR